MKRIYIGLIVLSGLALVSCSDSDSAAKQHLENARGYLAQQKFEEAKAELDSINTLYPKSFEQRRAGVSLLDSVRKAENNFMIENINERLVKLEPVVEELKKGFNFQKDEKYQEAGVYVPKTIGASGTLSYTTLHPGVEESGRIYLESFYIGGQKHNKIKVSEGENFVESLEVTGDGYIHRFQDLGKSYEIIRLIGSNENGVAKFIADNVKSNLKVNLSGQHASSYVLPKNIKEAIAKSYDLSVQMLLVDSLKEEVDKAKHRNFYLDNGRRTEIPMEEKNEQQGQE